MSNTGYSVLSVDSIPYDLINVYDSSYKNICTQSVVTGFSCKTTGKDLGSIFTLNTALSSAGFTVTSGSPCGLLNLDVSTDIGTYFVNTLNLSLIAAAYSSAVVDTNSNVVALPDQFNNFNNLAQTSSGTVNITLTNTNSVGVSSGNSTINNKNLPLISMPGGNCFMYNPMNTQATSISGFICVIYPMSNTSATTLNNLISANLSNGVSFRYPVSLSDPSVLNSDDIIANNSAVYVNGTNTNLIYDNTNKYVIMYVKFPGIAGMNFVIGSSVSSTGYNGYIGDLYYLSSSHTSADQQIMEGYLAWKWGMQSLLPTSHPYYSIQPFNLILYVPSPAYSSITSINGIAAVYISSNVILNGSNVTSWPCYNSTLYNLTSSSDAGTITSIAYPNNTNLSMVSFGSGGVSYISQPTNQLSSINGFICVIYPTAMSGSFSYLFCPNGPTNDLSFRYPHYGATTAVRNSGDVDYPNSSVYVNGVPACTYNNANQYTILYVKFPVISSCGITLGSTFLSRGFSGYIGDFVLLNSTHTNTDRIMLEGVLAWKWGLQTKLPSSHPFSSTASSISLPVLNYGGQLASAPTGCQAFYACNWVNNVYTGPIVKIRRSSDSTTQNFYIDSMGKIVTTQAKQQGTSLSSWLNGATAYVTTWYDQSGLGNHATQTLTGNQYIFKFQNGLYYIQGNSSNYLNIANAPIPSGNNDCNIAYKLQSVNSTTETSVISAGDGSSSISYLSAGISGITSSQYYTLLRISGITTNTRNIDLTQISKDNASTSIFNLLSANYYSEFYVTSNGYTKGRQLNTHTIRQTNSLPGNNKIGRNTMYNSSQQGSLLNSFNGLLSFIFIGNTIIPYRSTDFNNLNNIPPTIIPAPKNIGLGILLKPLFRGIQQYPTGYIYTAALYSCKWVNSDYISAPIFKIRASTDTTGALATDFYVDYTGTIITTLPYQNGITLENWLNGATAYVTTWYDQSSYGMHATQTTIASQPSFNLSTRAIDFSSPPNSFFNLLDNTVYGNSSYSLFFKLITNNTNGGVILFSGGGGTVGAGDSTVIQTGTPATMSNWWDGNYNVATSYTIGQNCGFVYDDTLNNITSYVNGLKTNTFSTTPQGASNALSTPVMIGNGAGYFAGQYLNDQLENLVIYLGTLTPTDIVTMNQI